MLANRLRTNLVAALLGGATFALTGAALAAPCPDDLPNPIYGAGGSAVTATLRQVAAAVASLPNPITVFYHDPGACIGFTELITGEIPATTAVTVKYWDAAGTQYTCEPPAGGLPVHFAHMGNTADFCVDYPDGLPEGFTSIDGPVQTVNLITDRDSSQRSISGEALYHIFGLGAARAGVAPWDDPSQLILRTTSSFVHQFIAASIFGNTAKVFYDHPTLGADRLGVQVQTNGDSVTAIVQAGATSPESPLGYVSGSAADAARSSVKSLAYQHFGQSCAYWPDSTESALDKINVRQGLYHFWTPGHFFAPVNANDEIENTAVEEFIGYFTGALTSPDEVSPPVLERIIRAGDIPLCAMEATREGTAGAVSSAAPDEPCGCYFEAIATGNASVCDVCDPANGNDDCASGEVCRFGYCESY